MCWWCVRQRLPVAVSLAVLLGASLWVLALVVWYRPMVPCGVEWNPQTGQMVATYCKATGPVWP